MGAKFRQIQRRIDGIRSTIKITRAMELVATSRIAKAQARLLQARPYAQRIQQAINELAGVTEVTTEFPLLKPREQVRASGLLLITSDRGLAGSYNSNVIRVAERFMRDRRERDVGVRLHVVGRKGLSYFRFRGYELASQATGISDAPRFQDAERVGRELVEEFVRGEVDEVHVAYTDFRSAGSQVATTTQLLPVKEERERREGEVPALYEFEPEPSLILSLLLPRYVNTVIFAALLESSTSEHAARRRAMKAATENGEELVKVYTRIANRERQAEITSEIMEVVGGAEALREGAERKRELVQVG
jgi:F-type H+-transporting ATPase subunit gamma